MVRDAVSVVETLRNSGGKPITETRFCHYKFAIIEEKVVEFLKNGDGKPITRMALCHYVVGKSPMK